MCPLPSPSGEGIGRSKRMLPQRDMKPNTIEEFISLIKGKDEVKLDDANRELVESVAELCRSRFQFFKEDPFFRYKGHYAVLKIDPEKIRIIRGIDPQVACAAMRVNAAKFRAKTEA